MPSSCDMRRYLAVYLTAFARHIIGHVLNHTHWYTAIDMSYIRLVLFWIESSIPIANRAGHAMISLGGHSHTWIIINQWQEHHIYFNCSLLHSEMTVFVE